MAQIDDHIDKLHDKYLQGSITEEEQKELFNFFKGRGFSEDAIPEMLYVSHPDYGKPNKDGDTIIV